MTHRHGPDATPVHSFAWDVVQRTTALAQDLGLYGAGRDLLSDDFSRNLRGLGHGYAEIEFEERPSETVLCFLADKADERSAVEHRHVVGAFPCASHERRADLARRLLPAGGGHAVGRVRCGGLQRGA